MQAQCQKYEFSLVGYCLMTNHVHVVRVPMVEELLAKAMGQILFLNTQYMNRLYMGRIRDG